VRVNKKAGVSVMSKMLKLLNDVRKDEEGAVMAEYVLLIALIAVALVGTLGLFANAMKGEFNTVIGQL
jgi:Flp pilus assembly pilin Flp